jgi:hypothetical protein
MTRDNSASIEPRRKLYIRTKLSNGIPLFFDAIQLELLDYRGSLEFLLM